MEASSPTSGFRSEAAGRTEWTIGGSEDCAYRIPVPVPRVAILAREDGRLFLRAVHPSVPVFVNQGRLATGVSWELTRYDTVQIANTTIEIDARLFVGDLGLGLDTTKLSYSSPGRSGRILCQGVYLRARPGTFTAIIGPSGCGKTVLLDLLNGYNRPAAGRIVVGGRFDWQHDFERVRGLVGFVPQGDVMIPELTVGRSLHYRLRLRYPGMSESVRDRIIRQTCGHLGFGEGEVARLLDRTIGGGELARRGLSGGERKRVNIAQELLGRPAILILDEPTSGLSSADADEIILRLRHLTSDEGLTVIASVHQPSREALSLFDDLLVMAEGGRLAYYGPAQRAAEFVERATDDPFSPEENAAEHILRLVTDPRDAERVVRAFGRCGPNFPEPLPDGHVGTRRATLAPGTTYTWVRSFRQGAALVQRNLEVLRADRASWLLAVWTVPFLALLVWLAGFRVLEDGVEFERPSRFFFEFDARKQEDVRAGRPIRVEAHAMDAARLATEPGGQQISRAAAQRRSAVVFVLVAAATWLGVMGGCREIAGEKAVARREFRTGVGLLPYLAAKLFALLLVLGGQCVVLTVLVVPTVLGYSPAATAGLGGVLWLGAIAAGAVGLLISALADSPRTAATAVPLVMVPQLLLGGILRPEVDMPHDLYWPRWIAALTVQRWAFEPALALDDNPRTRVMVQQWGDSPETYREIWDVIRFDEHGGDTVAMYFPGGPTGRHFILPCAVLVAGSVGAVGVAYLRLRRQFLR